jgi:hypothetical protein
MKIDNTTDHFLTGPKKFIGYIFLITGILLLTQNGILIGVIVVLVSLFFIFTYSGIEIDTNTRQIKAFNNYFGIIKIGETKNLDSYIGLTLVPIKRADTIASRANFTNTTIQKDYRIYLVNKAKKPALAIKICKTREQAQNSIDEFSIWLKLPVYSVK